MSDTEDTTEGAEAKPEKVKMPSQNGVTRPKPGTMTGRVWEIADTLSEAGGEPCKRSDVMKTGEAEGLNSSTIATQFGRWRKFHGLGKYNKAEAEGSDDAPTTE